MRSRSILLRIRDILTSPYFLTALHTSVFLTLLFLYIESSHEDRMFATIADHALAPGMTEQEEALALMHTTNRLMEDRVGVFAWKEKSLKAKLFYSADTQLNQAASACGSFTHALGRLLDVAGHEVRIVQMRCGDVWGCHIVTETNIDGRWVVLDPLFDLAFEKPNGELATFRDVQENWDDYRAQLPNSYNEDYNYSEARYTNWSKIPLVMPAVRSIMAVFMGDDVQYFSLRAHILNVYRTYMVMLIAGYLALLVVIGLAAKWRISERHSLRAAQAPGGSQPRRSDSSAATPPTSASSEPSSFR